MKKRIVSFITSFLLIITYIFNFLPSSINALNISQKRLWGIDRYLTSISIAQYGWQASDTAIIATGDDFPDALCAAPLAKKYNAPILLTEKNELKQTLSAELDRLKVKKVYIIGGLGVISQNVEDAIKKKNINCIRIAGENRYETSTKIAAELGSFSEVFIATGDDFPDALSVASIAASKGSPILLTQKDSIPTSLTELLKGKNISKTYIIGGPGVISDNVYNGFAMHERISGKDRYETNIAIINKFSVQLKQDNIFIATGSDFPDALSGSSLASLTLSPIILITNTSDNISANNYFNSIKNPINSIIVLGGEGAVANSISNNLYTIVWNNLNKTNPNDLNKGYTLTNEQKYEYTGTLKINTTAYCKTLDIEFFVGKLSESPYQKEISLQVVGSNAQIVTDEKGNKKITAALTDVNSGQTIEIKLIRTFTNAGIKYNTDLSKGSSDYTKFNEYGYYTSPEVKIESNDPLIKQQTVNILQGEKNPYFIAKKIFEYVNTTIEYNTASQYANKGALSALKTQKGVCEDFADLFVAMSRAAGVPARVVGGYWVDSFTPNMPTDVSSYRHAWAEYFLPDFGWIPVEPTFLKTNYEGIRIPNLDVFSQLPLPSHYILGYQKDLGYTIHYNAYSSIDPLITIEEEIKLIK